MYQIKVNFFLFAGLLHPIATNSNVAITKAAIVLPDTGRFKVTIIPVKRPKTITNSNAKTYDNIEAVTAINTLPSDIMKPAIKVTTTPPESIIPLATDSPPLDIP